MALHLADSMFAADARSPWAHAFPTVIVDEAHALRPARAFAPSSAQTRVVCALVARARRAVLLSGTPAFGTPAHLFAQLDALAPGAFSDASVSLNVAGGGGGGRGGGGLGGGRRGRGGGADDAASGWSAAANAVPENREGRRQFNQQFCGARALKPHGGAFRMQEQFDGHAFSDEVCTIVYNTQSSRRRGA